MDAAWSVAVFVTLVVAFALLVTAHVALSAGLVYRRPRWRGLVAFLVPPLAPFWGYESGLRRWSVIWVAAFLLYAVALMLAAL